MGSSLPIMVTKRAGQIECKRVVKWSAVFQLVFQPKIKPDINLINPWIQITPASPHWKALLLFLQTNENGDDDGLGRSA